MQRDSAINLGQLLGDVVRAFRQNVPDYLASGIVDLASGMLLAQDGLERHPERVVELISGATRDLFLGRNVVEIEQVWKDYRGVTDSRHYFREMVVYSDNNVHVFMRAGGELDVVAVVVCKKDVNVGLLLAQTRLVMRQLNALN